MSGKELATQAHVGYVRHGGVLTHTDFVKKVFKECVKQSLLLLALLEGFGPIVIFWDLLTPSRLYKLKFSEAKAAPVPPEQWVPINRRLGWLTALRADITLEERRARISRVFDDVEYEHEEEFDHFDYLEDFATYQVTRNRTIDDYLQFHHNPNPPNQASSLVLIAL